MAIEQYANAFATTLNGSILSGASSLTLTSATGAPAAPFRILAGSEIILVGARSGTACSSLTRGAEGTTAAAHSSGDAVTHILTRGSLLALPTVFNQAATEASKPAASQEGNLFLPSDGFSIQRDTGSAWAPWGPLFPLTDPNLQTFAWVNQALSTMVTTEGGICLKTTGVNSGDNVSILKKAAPATPYTITIGFLSGAFGTTSGLAGFCWRESSSGKLSMLLKEAPSSLSAVHFSGPGSFSAFILTTRVASAQGLTWLQASDDGTNRTMRWSADGQNFVDLITETSTTFLTADEVGFCINPLTASWAQTMTLLSWKEQ
jgi:hypothetical protein